MVTKFSQKSVSHGMAAYKTCRPIGSIHHQCVQIKLYPEYISQLSSFIKLTIIDTKEKKMCDSYPVHVFDIPFFQMCLVFQIWHGDDRKIGAQCVS